MLKSGRAENDLLLNVACSNLDAARKTAVRQLLNEEIDWNYLIESARQHGLLPLLNRHLTPYQSEIAVAKFEKIRREAIENSQSVLYLVDQLQNLLRRFAQEELSLLVFKGPVLAQMAYGEMSLRAAGDLDILIERRDFNRAKSVLESLGYQMTPPLTRKQETAHLCFHCEVQFIRDNGFTVVDLHWSLSPRAFPLRMNIAQVLNSAQRVLFCGSTLNTFGPEDLILFQSVHGAKHYWLRLEWISSLAEVIRSNSQIDWLALIKRARLARGIKMLALGMYLAQWVGDLEIPPDVFREIDRDERMKKVAKERMRELFRPQRMEYRSIKAVRENLKIMDRKRDVIASLLRAVFVPTISDWETLTLPGSLHLLYYVLRPFRLAGRYTVTVWQTLTSRVGFQTHPAPKIR